MSNVLFPLSLRSSSHNRCFCFTTKRAKLWYSDSVLAVYCELMMLFSYTSRVPFFAGQGTLRAFIDTSTSCPNVCTRERNSSRERRAKIRAIKGCHCRRRTRSQNGPFRTTVYLTTQKGESGNKNGQSRVLWLQSVSDEGTLEIILRRVFVGLPMTQTKPDHDGCCQTNGVSPYRWSASSRHRTSVPRSN